MLRGYSRGTHGALSENPGETLGYSRGTLWVLQGYCRVLPSTPSQTDYWTADNTTLKFDKCDVKSGVCSGNLTANGMEPLGSPHEPINRQTKQTNQQTNKQTRDSSSTPGPGLLRLRRRSCSMPPSPSGSAACRLRRTGAGRRAMCVAPKLGARIKKGRSLTGVGGTRGYSGGRVRGVACLCWQARARASRGTPDGSVRAAPTDTCASARAAAQCPSSLPPSPAPRPSPTPSAATPPPLRTHPQPALAIERHARLAHVAAPDRHGLRGAGRSIGWQ